MYYLTMSNFVMSTKAVYLKITQIQRAKRTIGKNMPFGYKIPKKFTNVFFFRLNNFLIDKKDCLLDVEDTARRVHIHGNMFISVRSLHLRVFEKLRCCVH